MALEHESLTERIIFVEDTVVVDLKAIKNLEDIHFAVVRSQLKAVGRQHGLLLNFARTTLEPKRVRHSQ
jgi:GxxExxY protein